MGKAKKAPRKSGRTDVYATIRDAPLTRGETMVHRMIKKHAGSVKLLENPVLCRTMMEDLGRGSGRVITRQMMAYIEKGKNKNGTPTYESYPSMPIEPAYDNSIKEMPWAYPSPKRNSNRSLNTGSQRQRSVKKLTKERSSNPSTRKTPVKTLKKLSNYKPSTRTSARKISVKALKNECSYKPSTKTSSKKISVKAAKKESVYKPSTRASGKMSVNAIKADSIYKPSTRASTSKVYTKRPPVKTSFKPYTMANAQNKPAKTFNTKGKGKRRNKLESYSANPGKKGCDWMDTAMNSVSSFLATLIG